MFTSTKSALLGASALTTLATYAMAGDLNIPAGDLERALDAYTAQTGVHLLYSEGAVEGVRTGGVRGSLETDAALSHLLSGTGFTSRRDSSGAIAIIRRSSSALEPIVEQSMRLAQAAPTRVTVETVTVTSSKLGGADVQSIPIAITALSQEQLTSRQVAGGPDLVKEVPNLTFTKTNFTGYSIQIRGIGTQAISVATDPAVAVAFNDTPFIRNHFFEQEFYDLAQVEVLRGPQGTLYGRNATAGVVNITSAKPTDQFEAMASGDIGNYKNRRFEGMINLPIVGDKLDLRVAGEWTKRDGYSFNETTGQQIDGRDLWSGRVTLGWKPASNVQTYLIWEHFQENDDRLRSGKQLCKTDPGPSSIDGVPVPPARGAAFAINASYFSQGCLPSSLYSADAFGVPNGFSLPFITGASFEGLLDNNIDPYSQTRQSSNLRDIQSAIEPKYIAKNDTVEFNASWNVTPTLTFYSDTGYNRDFLWSSEDYNRFDTSPGIFLQRNDGRQTVDANGVFCDPQLGCSDRLVVQDLATEHSWQLSQEFRMASSFSGPLNFSAGANLMHYETKENYYVFSNTFTMISLNNVGCDRVYDPGVTNNLYCLSDGRSYPFFKLADSIPTESPQYVDPNPITNLDNQGHNYFLSQNPYYLNSYAGFGEAYYDVTQDLKLTAGLRWTDDEKHFPEIPSQLLAAGYGYPGDGEVNQSWHKWTGRFVANWSPKLPFTDQSLFYASYSRGYKAGGANPPGPVLLNADISLTSPTGEEANNKYPVHPLTFAPEYVNAFELGSKNKALDGALTLNGDVFFYDYKGYQISEIVDRTAINLNFDATVKGAELEATWEPLPGLKFTFAGGYEQTRIDNNQFAIDLIDRAAGTPGWVVMKPSVGQSSNCIFPSYVAAAIVQQDVAAEGSVGGQGSEGDAYPASCGVAYNANLDPVTQAPYAANTDLVLPDGTHYHGFDPATAPNNGEGFAKNVSGNELPNAPHVTLSLAGDYTVPVSSTWAATLHSDFYLQSDSWARVFNDNPYDRLHGYTNVNLALILTDATGWQVMGYVKNVFDTTAITGDFLNSDDSGLTTNIFLTDPRLFGVRVTKHFDDDGTSSGGSGFLDGGGKPQAWIQLGGNFNLLNAGVEHYIPSWLNGNTVALAHGGAAEYPDMPAPSDIERAPTNGFDWEGKLTLQPNDSDWVLKAGIRYGRAGRDRNPHKTIGVTPKTQISLAPGVGLPCSFFGAAGEAACSNGYGQEFVDGHSDQHEDHMMLDFTLGKDVGLGAFGEGAQATIGGGVRIAQFHSGEDTLVNVNPHYAFDVPYAQKYHDVYNDVEQAERSFHGIGPQLTWDTVNPVYGNVEDGQFTFDWGLNIAVLFGEQKASVHIEETQCEGVGFASGLSVCSDVPTAARTVDRTQSRHVTVPNIGGYVGASMLYHHAKVSVGYRAGTFFNAMDGGQETADSKNRGFYGPYLNMSLGL